MFKKILDRITKEQKTNILIAIIVVTLGMLVGSGVGLLIGKLLGWKCMWF